MVVIKIGGWGLPVSVCDHNTLVELVSTPQFMSPWFEVAMTVLVVNCALP